MRFSRALPTTIAVVIALIGSAFVTGAAAQGAKPKADDVGITDSQIRLAVIADVDNPAVPGLFQGAVDVMRAWAKLVNKKGGVAGRKVAIDFVDSHLSPSDARSGAIKACTDDFAMVGTEALFLSNVDDMVACPDKQGTATGIPDLAGLALDPAQKCSPVTFLTSGDASFCATRDQHPQTYAALVGDARYYAKKVKGLHGIFTLDNTLKGPHDSQQVVFEGSVRNGIKKDGEGFYDITAMAPQSALTPIVRVAKTNNSTFVENGSSFGIMVLMRREAKLQGLNSVKLWACNQGCYDQQFLQQGGADVEDTHTVLTVLPFYSDYKQVPILRDVVKELGGPTKLTANSVAALTSALLFQDAAEKAVANGGTLTRASLFEALKNEHKFDAQGVMGPQDVGNKVQPGCFVIANVKNGKWVREYPSKPGTFDCNKKNVVKLKLDFS